MRVRAVNSTWRGAFTPVCVRTKVTGRKYSVRCQRTPPALGVSELRITTERGQSDAVADGILTAAKKFLGAATKGVPNNGELQVLVEIPANKAAEFKSALSPLPGVKEVNGEVSAGNSAEKISVIIALTEAR